VAVHQNVIGVVDDDPAMRSALQNMLSSFGYRTELYASAQDFIDVAFTSQAACLVLDIQLGEMSGFELARYLSNFALAFPVIFMSASDDESFRRQALSLGGIEYFKKPFSADHLREAIIKAINANPNLR
jgi:two-component system response regulator FixJ